LERYLWVMLGSALGGVGRYWLTGLVARLMGETFPWGTLVVNVLGSGVIGLADALAGAGGGSLAGLPARDFVMAGLCGGFTTFSAFSLQMLNLLRDGRTASAWTYAAASVVICLVSVWLGRALAGAWL
jgi:CrcB protein